MLIRRVWRSVVLGTLIFGAANSLSAAKNSTAVTVIIGNRIYSHSVQEVVYAHRDADSVRAFSANVLGYREGNVIDLRDATLAQLVAVFGTQANHKAKLFDYLRAGRSDVLVYYSGHGVPGLKKRRGYLLPVDGDPNAAEFTGYSLDLLYSNLRKLPARSVTVILDACFSGETSAGSLIRATSGIRITPKLPHDVGRLTILTAAQADQVASWDEKREHGLFTEYLLRALHGRADRSPFGDGNRKITLKEIRNYLDEEMSYEARRRFGRYQKATIIGDNNIVVSVWNPNLPPYPPELRTISRAKSGDSMRKLESAAIILEPVEESYVAVQDTVVRSIPDASGEPLERILKGAEIYVAGKVNNRKWYSVERDNRRIGYVYTERLRIKPSEKLLEKPKSTDIIGKITRLLTPNSVPQGSLGSQNSLLGSLAGSEVGKSLDRADRMYMQKTTQQSLEAVPSGSTSSWRNPNSGNSGTVTPQRTYQKAEGTYCREFQQTASVGGRTEEAYGTACRHPDGTWKVVKN